MNELGITRVIKGLLVLLLVFSGLFVSTSPAHAVATLSLSPGSGSFGQGQAFTVAVNVNTGGEAVNAVEAVLTFPADKLKANYISHSGSGFDINAESTVGSGVVRIAKGKLPPGVVGSRRVASVGFTALSQGTATIAISGESKVLREADSANIFAGGGGATFNITGAAATSPGTDQTAPAVQKDTLAPNISEIEAISLGVQTATIIWKTDEKADSQVEYGFVESREQTDFKYFFLAQSEAMATEHKLALDTKTLLPGHLYHFRVLSKDEAGNQAQSGDQTFIIPGYQFTVTVTDAASKLVEGAKVRLPSLGLEAFTDSAGRVSFSDLPTGDVPVLVEYRGQVKDASTKIAAAENNLLTVVLGQKVAKFKASPLIVGASAIALILALAGIGGLFYFKKKSKKDDQDLPSNKPPQSS